MLWKLCVLLFVFTSHAYHIRDEEQLIARAAESLKDSLQYINSYTASTRMTRAHAELLNIVAQLEPLERKLQQLAAKASFKGHRKKHSTFRDHNPNILG